jgi:dihydroflavonol-4-reductase
MHKDSLILLTGASGFIGGRISLLLAGMGCAVRVLSRTPAGQKTPHEIVRGDITEPADCRRAMRDVALVIHAAGEKRNPALYQAVNALGTQNLIDAALAAGVRRFVHVSSVGTVGADPLCPRVVTEEDPCLPRDGYEVSKNEAEERVRKASAKGLSTAILRPANVFGDGDPERGLLSLIRSVKRGFFAYLGGVVSLSNYVYVGDVASACLQLLEDPSAAGKVFQISDDCLLEEFVSEIAMLLGVGKPVLAVPESLTGLMRGLLRQGERLGVCSGSALMGRLSGLNNRVHFPNLRLQQELGWRCEIGWKRGLERLIGFYRMEGLL